MTKSELTDKIVNEFPHNITKCYFEEINDFTFLRIEITKKDLNDVIDLTNKINYYIDQFDDFDEKYYLDVFSSGVDKELNINDLDKYLDKTLKIQSSKNEEPLIGKLFFFDEKQITIKVNNKGRMQKVDFKWEYITKINYYATVTKKRKKNDRGKNKS